MSKDKAKLLCSLGGDFFRRQGKICYVGGKTRLVSIDRTVNFRGLLSKMADLCGSSPSSIGIKFQLPDETLESRLVSIESDDDVWNMMEEFDSTQKIRVYLFTSNQTMEAATPIIVRESAISTTPVMAIAESKNSPSTSGVILKKDSQYLVVGQEFPDVQSFRNALIDCAIAMNFEYQIVKSDTRRITAKCASDGCLWRIHASKLPEVKTFRIRTLKSEHSCVRLDRSGHRQANKEWIANCIKDRLRNNVNYKPREIVRDIQRDYGVLISYKRAFLGREKAMKDIQRQSRMDIIQVEDNHSGKGIYMSPIKDVIRIEDIDSEYQAMEEVMDDEIDERPRKKQISENVVKEVRPLRCTHCGQIGHNKRTCRTSNPVQGEAS